MKKKKRNKKQGDRKPVDQWVRFQAKAGVDDIIEFDFSGGAGSVFSNQILPNTCYAYTAYPRDSGKYKVINQTPGQLKSTRGSLKDNIESSFNSIAGIDTNDYLYKGKRVSIVASFCSMHFAKSAANGFMIDQLPAFVIENIPENINSEIIGWHLFFEHTIPLLNLSSNNKLALVTDSELGRHDQINRREAPYFLGHHLPDHVGLLYASSDTGTDAPNQLVKWCDKASRSLYYQIQTGEIVLPETLGGKREWCDGYCYINFTNSKYAIGKNA